MKIIFGLFGHLKIRIFYTTDSKLSFTMDQFDLSIIVGRLCTHFSIRSCTAQFELNARTQYEYACGRHFNSVDFFLPAEVVVCVDAHGFSVGVVLSAASRARRGPKRVAAAGQNGTQANGRGWADGRGGVSSGRWCRSGGRSRGTEVGSEAEERRPRGEEA